ncbi:SufD family Fe-S cluster assembly protein [Peptoniphilus sp. GNH]|nr:SufB/sufD domain protein [Clostridiales bacterium KA00134]UHR03146.1 SufD family Fe-S cluster assembly protein [Peptoniphilus sp. GNH]
MQGNNISFKTFSWLGVNRIDVDFPKVNGKRANIEKMEEFTALDYGVSKEILDFNIQNNHDYRILKSGECEDRDFGIIEYNEDQDIINQWYDLVAEEGSKLEVTVLIRGNSKKRCDRNTVIRVLAKKNSKVNLRLLRFDNDMQNSFETIAVCEKENATVKINQVELTAGNLVLNYKNFLKGEKASSDLDSIYFGSGNSKLDFIYEAQHHGVKTKSDIRVNGALVDKAYKSLKSNLDFKKGSSMSIGNEEEYTLLLSDDVKALSLPILLAGEDDVEGNHAASAGKMDKDLLFYIMSRGYDIKEATTLVIESKFSATIEEMPTQELRDEIINYIESRL